MNVASIDKILEKYSISPTTYWVLLISEKKRKGF